MPEQPALDLSVSLGDSSFKAAGPADLVLKAFGEFKELSKQGSGPQATGGIEAPDKEPDAAPSPPQDSPASTVPLPQFLKRDEIKGNAAIATAIVVWAADHDGKESLTASGIRELWRTRTSVKVPENLPRDIGSAVKKGWLHKSGEEYSATGFGRTAIGLE